MEAQIKAKPYLTTFKVSDQVPRKVKLYKGEGVSPFESLQAYKENKSIRVLQGTTFPPGGRTIPQNNGFVKTVVAAYNTHHNLIIRPDDLWLAIMTQFSFYLNKHAEKYRGQFVNFEGQKELIVCVPGVLNAFPADLCVRLMSEEIHKNLVDGEVKTWILPDFSTTTPDDLVTTGVVFMAAMKKYFTYKFCLCCGIPYITLDGTLEDWKNIETRIQKLKDYDLGDWLSLLQPIIAQFVRAKAGDVDVGFWNRICNERGGGSGPTYLSGWVTAFCRFDTRGNPLGKKDLNNTGNVERDNAPWLYIDMQDIPSGVVEVDVTIDDHGIEYKSVMFAGHVASFVEKDGVSLKPGSGWAIVLKHPLPGEEGETDQAKVNNHNHE